jgi:hypothetical protein
VDTTDDSPVLFRLARGSHKPGTLKACGGNILSWEQGDNPISDYPSGVAVPLARIVQYVNDDTCRHPQPDPELLCPACSVAVLDFAHRTVGTATHPDELLWSWMDRVTDRAIVLLRPLEQSAARAGRVDYRYGQLTFSSLLSPPVLLGQVWDERARALRFAETYPSNERVFAALRGVPGMDGVERHRGLTAARPVLAALSSLRRHLPPYEVLEFAHTAVDVWHELAGSAPVPVPAEVTERAIHQVRSAPPVQREPRWPVLHFPAALLGA